MAQLKDTLVTGDLRVTGNLYDNSGMVAYCTCATAAATAAKVVSTADTAWTLKVGDVISVYFTNTNTASTPTLNVMGSGAIPIWYNNAKYTSSGWVGGYASRVNNYVYNGSYWIFMSTSYDMNDNTVPAGYCTTAAGTAAKAATYTSYYLSNNTYIYITISNSNTAAGALTLNINGKGAKPIYINGEASSETNYTLPAGTYIVYYNGTYYSFYTEGRIKIAKPVLGQSSYGSTLPTTGVEGQVFFLLEE